MPPRLQARERVLQSLVRSGVSLLDVGTRNQPASLNSEDPTLAVDKATGQCRVCPAGDDSCEPFCLGRGTYTCQDSGYCFTMRPSTHTEREPGSMSFFLAASVDPADPPISRTP